MVETKNEFLLDSGNQTMLSSVVSIKQRKCNLQLFIPHFPIYNWLPKLAEAQKGTSGILCVFLQSIFHAQLNRFEYTCYKFLSNLISNHLLRVKFTAPFLCSRCSSTGDIMASWTHGVQYTSVTTTIWSEYTSRPDEMLQRKNID